MKRSNWCLHIQQESEILVINIYTFVLKYTQTFWFDLLVKADISVLEEASTH